MVTEASGWQASAIAREYRRALDLESAGKLGEAQRLFSAILAAAPDHVDALHHLGLVAFRAGRLDEALELMGRSIELSPCRADFRSNAAAMLLTAGRLEKARAAIDRAIELDNGHPHAHVNHGHLLRKLNRPQDAIVAYERAIEIDPGNAKTYIQFAGLLREMGRLDDAVAALYRARAHQPGDLSLLTPLCALLEEADRPADVEAALSAASHAAPCDPELFNRLGTVRYRLGKLDEAEAAYRQAIRLDGAYAEAHCNLGILLLALQRWSEGWSQYDWRRWARRIGEHGTHFRLPQWRGPGAERVDTLLLWSEQAIGDEILFASMVAEAARHAKHVVLECEPRLQPLFARSFPALDVVPRANPPHPRTTAPDVTTQSPTGSLPGWFRRSDESFPAHAGYLRADPARAASLRERYRQLGCGPLIGISWRSRNAQVGVARSIPLDAWMPIFAVAGATFIAVQYGDCADELAAVHRLGAKLHRDSTIDPLSDMDGLAAQLAALDLVVTIDNSTLHLAGALGRPCWAMIPTGTGLIWYWSFEREDCLWYPSLRLYRQPTPGDWAPVVARVAERLSVFAQGQ